MDKWYQKESQIQEIDSRQQSTCNAERYAQCGHIHVRMAVHYKVGMYTAW